MKRSLSISLVLGWLAFQGGMSWAGKGDVIELVGNGEVHWSQGIILAKGSGAPPKEAKNIAQARLMAERAALVDARRNLLETLKGVWVDSNTLVENFMVKSDEIRLKAEGFIQGAMEIRQLRRYLSDGAIEVTVAMNLQGDFLALMLNPPVERPAVKPPPVEKPLAPVGRPPEIKTERAPDPSIPPGTKEKPAIEPKPHLPPSKIIPPEKPATETKPPAKKEELPKYTGLVIDARGLGLRPALLPKILDESGEELYLGTYVPAEKVAQNGVALYSRDLTSAQTHFRVGKNPLTVKGLKLKANYPSDIVLRSPDSDQVRPFAREGTFLEDCRVMIVLD